jgi:hypothetical protein
LQAFFSTLKNHYDRYSYVVYEAVEREKRCFCCFKHNNSVIDGLKKNNQTPNLVISNAYSEDESFESHGLATSNR